MITILRNALIIDKKGLEISHQTLVIKDGIIEWNGLDNELPLEYLKTASSIHDCAGKLLTPGLIDCHTHLVYAGDRADEFKLRLQGVSYTEIAKAGGGILSTVKKTREASEASLFNSALLRILDLRNQGVTTVEIKSGYGLDLETELKMLRVARKLGEATGMMVKTTFLGAHAIPPEYLGKSQEYVDMICEKMLPTIAESHLADAVDVFCEHIGFTLSQTEQIFQKAQDLNLPIKCHAEQLSNLGASVLAANYQALSCDHLEFLDIRSAKALAKAGTIAVLLPGAFYYLKEKIKPPIQILKETGVDIAIATDCNPGSSPTTSLLLMMNMACQLFDLTVEEVLSAVTYQAAKALGVQNERGSIKKGMAADLVLWSINSSAALCYYFAYPIPCEVMIGGKWIKKETIFE